MTTVYVSLCYSISSEIFNLNWTYIIYHIYSCSVYWFRPTNLKFTLATITMVSCQLHQSLDGFYKWHPQPTTNVRHSETDIILISPMFHQVLYEDSNLQPSEVKGPSS